MPFYVGRLGWRVNDTPEADEPRHGDPAADMARAAAAVRARNLADNPPWQPWPPPEIPMRVIEPGAAPDAVAALSRRLQAAGWRVVITYCRGTKPARQKRHQVVVDSYAVRAATRGRRAVAIWWRRAGKLETQGVLVWGDQYARWIGIQEFEGGL